MSCLRAAALFLAAFLPAVAAAQSGGIAYSEDFQSHAAGARAAGWRDSWQTDAGARRRAVNTPHGALFAIVPDPVAPANLAYGFNGTAGTGAFSTLLPYQFGGTLEYSGRLLRTTGDTATGLTFFSSTPDRDAYYVISVGAGASTMRLASSDGHAIGGDVDGDVAIEANRWIRFRIRVDATGPVTSIRARFWTDGAPEAQSDSIDASDSTATRPRAGRIGVWSGGNGRSLVDDLSARSSTGSDRDTQPPVIAFFESGVPLDSSKPLTFRRPVAISISVSDESAASYAAVLDGIAYTSGDLVSALGAHTLNVHAVDAVGNASDARLDFTIESPSGEISIVITAPAAGEIESAARVLVRGTVENATSVMVNGIPADLAASSFTADVPLLEGNNVVRAVASGPNGTASASVNVIVDTRPPELTIAAPAEGACLDASEIEIRGTASDRELKSVAVTSPGAAPIEAEVQSDHTWRVVLPATDERFYTFAIEATDAVGHVTTRPLHVRIDRIRPAIAILESGAALTDRLFARPVTPLVTVSEADAALTLTLDGKPYARSTAIAAEGSHELLAVATDCAGHREEAVARFSIDVTPPEILLIAPSPGATVGPDAVITGTASADAVTIAVSPSGRSYGIEKGAFSLAGLPLAEGANKLVFHVTDAAGNAADIAYALVRKSTPLTVEILESGNVIGEGSLFNRAVTPTIEASDGAAVIAATVNGSGYVPGTPIGEDGTYTIEATATDAAARTAKATARFAIDRTPPAVSITTPADGATVDGDVAVVAGSVSGDAVALLINGVAVPMTNGGFSANVPLDRGPNTISALARDAAGNLGAAHVTVTRPSGLNAILLTAPAEGMVTNRATALVAGQLLTPSAASRVTINGSEVPVDSRGVFRKADFAVSEGDNTVRVALSDGAGETNSVSVRIVGDRTPPRVRILESGQPLADGARFAERASIAVEAVDRGASVPFTLEIDGSTAAVSAVLSAPGGHVIVASARDSAGNETRVERTLFIGSNGASGCVLGQFDPPSGSVVTSPTITIAGQSGGASGVKVNGIAAYVSGGGFCATVELPEEGDNAVSIVCTDSNGNPTGAASTLTLRRITGQPSLSITTPDEGSFSASGTTVVAGAVSGATSVEVNGVAATVSGGTFSAPGVRLNAGLNVIVARARNEAGRVASASRRVTYLKDPPAIAITSPLPGLTTGASRIDVSGTWSNVDPATITAGGVAAGSETWSDTSGSFILHDVPLTAGAQTVVVAARDVLGRAVTAATDITVIPNAPSISITEPVDGAILGAAASTVTMRGSFVAAPGSAIDVAGVPAAVDVASSTFTATVPLSAAVGGVTPIIARVAEPDGMASVDAVRVLRTSAAPTVVEVFPPPGALEIDPGAMPMVLFSAPMSRASLASSFRLETSAGVPVSGTLRLDREVLTFAPAALLTPGGTYTIRIGRDARDLGGNPMAADSVTTFTVAPAAPETAPSVTPLDAVACSQQRAIRGTASPGARVRLDFGALTLTSTATSTGAFVFDVPLSGRSGCQIARVRTVGSDGSLSPATEVRFQVDCSGLQVTGAAYDRTANRINVSFSREVKGESLAAPGAIQLQLLDGRAIAATAAVQNPATAIVITPAENLSTRSFLLLVSTAVEDLAGGKLAFPYSQSFVADDQSEPQAHHGDGFVSGEVFDAGSGRPLSGATVTIDSIVTTTDARGRYGSAAGEGPHTINASATGFVSVWRQVIVAAGASVIPIDIRLARRGTTVAASGEVAIQHGGSSGTPRVELRIPSGAIPDGTPVTLTSTTAQSLPGLLPLGWSPLACASVESSAAALPGAQVKFAVPLQEIVSAAQSIVAVQYRPERDDWLVIASAPNLSPDGTVTVQVGSPAAIALVYPDRGPSLSSPPPAVTGAALRPAVDLCASGSCPPLAAKSFVLAPEVVLPSGSTIATLTVDGSSPANFSSGTAVQAYVDEELQLADGSRVADPPFSVDLLLYRKLDGASAVAEFQLAPSPRAAQVILQAGFEHIRIVPYAGRLDRGTLLGPEGGRVPGDGGVAVEIPPGAAPEAVRATTATISDLASFGAIAGFHIVRGFTLDLQRAGGAGAAELIEPARATFAGINATLQHVVVEVLDDTPFGRVFRLAAETVALPDGSIATRPIDTARLPLEGIRHEGRYLLLAADVPIAFASGNVRIPAGPFVADALVRVEGLGIADLSRPGGLFAVAVPAQPAAAFRLVPRSRATGDGAPYTHPVTPAPGEAVRVGDLLLTSQPPIITSIMPADGAVDVSLGTNVKVTFAPAIDPSSITSSSITVIDRAGGDAIPGNVTAEGTSAAVWVASAGARLLPGRTYLVSIAPTIRGTSGAPLGGNVVTRFTTATQLASGEVYPERIRITIPDATGHSLIVGTAGALPAGWNAVAVRRTKDFSVRPQSTSASDGSFTIAIAERVALSDQIDLQAINLAGSVAAIIPLTPFVRPDGSGFVAPPEQAARFTTPDGRIAVNVPAGAFDVPTEISVAAAPSDAFSAVPDLATALRLGPGVRLDFAGTAKQRLDVELPAPADAASTTYFLGRLGDSVRGPRIEIVDTLRFDNGRLLSSTAAAVPSSAKLRSSANAFGTQQDVKNALIGATRAGIYCSVALTAPMTWFYVDVAMTGQALDLFSTSLDSIFVSAFTLLEKRGKALIPVPAGKAFQLVGYDAATGLEAFRIDRSAGPAADPLNAVSIPIATAADVGPYPLRVKPGRVEIVVAPPDEATLTSIAGLTILQSKGKAILAGTPPHVPAGALVRVVNLANGSIGSSVKIPQGEQIAVPAAPGDSLVVAIGSTDVDPDERVEIVFSSALDFGSEAADVFLHESGWIRILAGRTLATLADVTAQVTFTSDSQHRRIALDLPLQRATWYRVVLDGKIAGPPVGTSPGLKLGQRVVDGAYVPAAPKQITFDFRTRAPGGVIGGLTLTDGKGTIRDMALSGNVALIATTAGLHAFDVSDPAAIGTAAAALKSVTGDFWSVAVDRHGRVFATGLGDSFGLLSSYRLEDFVAAGPVTQVGGANVSWRPGVSAQMPLGSETLLADRPEALPRRLQILPQDDEQTISGAELLSMKKAVAKTFADGSQLVAVSFTVAPTFPYLKQRITVVNRTRGGRWSADIPRGTQGSIAGIVAGELDEIVVARNTTTWAVVSLYGFGIGVFDVNAIESNDQAAGAAGYKTIQERLLITPAAGEVKKDLVYPAAVFCNGVVDPTNTPCTCDPNLAAPAGVACEIRDLTFSPDSAIFAAATAGDLKLLAVEQNRGVLDLEIAPPKSDPASPSVVTEAVASPGNGLSLAQPFQTSSGLNRFLHPRLRALSDLYAANGGNNLAPLVRFSSIAPYRRGTHDYALVAANGFGLLVVDTEGALKDEALADVIWIPAGAVSVRAIPSSDLAVVVDGAGRVLLVDLKRIDERGSVALGPTRTGKDHTCMSAACAAGLFPTAKKCLQSKTPALPKDATWLEVGVDDPRIVWKSEPKLVSGTLPPVIDPDTGILLTGDLTGVRVNAVAAVDPRISFTTRTASGPGPISSVIPLGIAPEPPSASGESPFAAFRVELALPGGVSGAAPLRLAVESERVPGVATEQTSDLLPLAHLRQRTRSGAVVDARASESAGFVMRRLLPYDATDEQLKAMRFQRGFNWFVSPWVVAVADPRASERYDWKDIDPATEGCVACRRPGFLQEVAAPAAFELMTRGRFIAVRPEAGTFNGTKYDFLADRLEARVPTVMADVVRQPEAEIAPQNPPTATGALVETTYLHSGELEETAADLDAGGRNGFNVVIGRIYRSRSIGAGPLGAGWDSPMFKRLRQLPNRDVEYRDGAGNAWLFRSGAFGYLAPPGLFLSLSRGERGWVMRDQRNRLSFFDELGRLSRETDEYFDTGSGNAIDFLYDSAGRLTTIVDSVGRRTTLDYYGAGPFEGLLASVRDWHQPSRVVDYLYDSKARLVEVRLPEVSNTDNVRPSVRYAYQDATLYNDRLELENNLTSITEPHEVAIKGKPRVEFTYGQWAPERDRLKQQTWATGDHSDFAYVLGSLPGVPSVATTQATVTDALLQPRTWKISGFDAAAHATSLVESGVPTAKTAYGELPESVKPGVVETESPDRTWTFAYDSLGLLTSTTLDGVSQSSTTFAPAPGVTGPLPVSGTTAALNGQQSLTRKVDYEEGSAFVRSTSAGGLVVQTPEPTRQQTKSGKALIASNDSIERTTRYDAAGRLVELTSSGGTAPAAGENVKYAYKPDDSGELVERGELAHVLQGGLLTAFQYTETSTTSLQPRDIITTTTLDSWRRPVHVSTTGPGLTTDEWTFYDASGRIAWQERQQGTKTVRTTFTYDELGRQKSVSVDNVAVGEIVGSVTTSYAYELGKGVLTTTLPTGAVITRELDGLGRVAREVTSTGGKPIERRYAYDKAGNRVIATDMRTTTASAFDVHGREVATLHADGTVTQRRFNEWGHAVETKTLTPAGSEIASAKFDVTAAGRLRSLDTPVDESLTRHSEFAWDGAGRTTGTATGNRASHRSYDDAGRLISSAAGEGSSNALAKTDVLSTYGAMTGWLPQHVDQQEKSGPPVGIDRQYDTSANVTNETVGNTLAWRRTFDQSGNLTESEPPSRPKSTYEYDSRGSLLMETMGDGTTNRYRYDAAGVMSRYLDPATPSEETSIDNDLLGRPLKRVYADGSTEVFSYDADRLERYTDRQERTQLFTYNGKGQLTRIDAQGGPQLDQLDYDDAGRLTAWTNRNSKLTWENFNLDGRPRRTTLTVYRDGTAFAAPQVVGEFRQEHAWNEHGERVEWTMPRPPSFTTSLPWTDRVRETRDVLGNVVSVDRTLFGSPSVSNLLTASYRNVGRPDVRTLTTACGSAPCAAASIVRTYDYDPATGLPSGMSAASKSIVVAGSRISAFDGTQIASIELPGISNGSRASSWKYDARSRLTTASLGRTTEQMLTPADFRESLVRTPRFDDGTRKKLEEAKVDVTPFDTPSQGASQAAGHKIAKLDDSAIPFTYNFAERTGDESFTYEWDEKGRLVRATENVGSPPKLAIMRVTYTYDGNDRMITRRVETAQTSSKPLVWQLATPAILTDGIPADAIFVWDPITDRIAAVFDAATMTLSRQIIHGGNGYDDPIEVTLTEPANPSLLNRLYPVYEEVGTGNLQAALNASGEIVSRKMFGDAYGDESFSLGGPAIDKVEMRIAKNSSGALSSVDVTIRSTEELVPGTIAAGVRLAARDADGRTLQTALVAESLADPFTATWTMTAAEWTAFTSGATSISIAATPSLRASAWGAAVPILPAPAWATATLPVSSTEYPVEVRESLSDLSSRIASMPSGSTSTLTLYEVADLALLGNPDIADDPARFLVTSPFQSLPFRDSVTNLTQVRARWLDHRTGTFLSPDPMGYRDSANLYAYCGGDPVNCRDASGLIGIFLDGTWDHEVPSQAHVPSNVRRLFLTYTAGERHYYRGLGNVLEHGLVGQALGGIFGLGGAAIVNDAMAKITAAYARGDRVVDIVGFSRGASLALDLAGEIEKRPNLHGMRIRFVGLFDAVGSFGDPGNPLNIGYDLRGPTSALLRVHLISRDEARQNFELIRPAGFLEKTLPGGHSNVGGTWPNREFGNRALWIMMDEANSRLKEQIFDPSLTDFGTGDSSLPTNVTDTYERCKWLSAPVEMCQQKRRGVFNKSLRWGSVVAEAPKNRRPHVEYPFK